MSLHEIEEAIAQLPRQQFAELTVWMAEFEAQEWDAQIEADLAAGRLDHLVERAKRDFDSGNVKPL